MTELDGAPLGADAVDRPQGSDQDTSHSPTTGWRPFMAILALVLGLAIAFVGSLVLELLALGAHVHVTSNYTPPGLEIADTVVQDLGFVAASVWLASRGRRVAAWQFGLRRPGVGWRSALGMVVLLLLAFLILTAVWSQFLQPEKETLLKQLGTNEGALLLICSAGLTCVVAPMCEEFLFRGFMFTALREWRGTLPAALIDGLIFGGIHVGSAPALDLAPLAALGFGLCLLYRYSGSLFPGMAAHSLNNCLAFASLEGWSVGDGALLMAASLAGIAVVALAGRRLLELRAERMMPRPGT